MAAGPHGDRAALREPLARRIGHLIEAALPGGAKLSFQPPPQQQPPPALPDLLSTPTAATTDPAALAPPLPATPASAHDVELIVTSILARVDDPWVLEHEREHRESLAAKGVLDVPDQAVRLLQRTTALWIAISDFENTYGVIWGGQVEFMRDMLGAPKTMAEAAAFFETWSKRNPDRPDTLDRWLGFFTARRLIERIPDETTGEDLLALTLKGRSFLRFLSEFNRSDPSYLR